LLGHSGDTFVFRSPRIQSHGHRQIGGSIVFLPNPNHMVGSFPLPDRSQAPNRLQHRWTLRGCSSALPGSSISWAAPLQGTGGPGHRTLGNPSTVSQNRRVRSPSSAHRSKAPREGRDPRLGHLPGIFSMDTALDGPEVCDKLRIA